MAAAMRLLAALYVAISVLTVSVSGEPQAVRNVTAVIKNGCNDAVWTSSPAPKMLKAGDTTTVSLINEATDTVEATSLWVKTGCASVTGSSCDSGECNSDTCPWDVPESTPATMVKFGMSSGFLNAEVATQSGFNVPAYVSFQGKTILSCNLQLSECPPANVIKKNGKAVGCATSPNTSAFNELLKNRCPLSLNGFVKPSLVEHGVYTVSFCTPP